MTAPVATNNRDRILGDQLAARIDEEQNVDPFDCLHTDVAMATLCARALAAYRAEIEATARKAGYEQALRDTASGLENRERFVSSEHWDCQLSEVIAEILSCCAIEPGEKP